MPGVSPLQVVAANATEPPGCLPGEASPECWRRRRRHPAGSPCPVQLRRRIASRGGQLLAYNGADVSDAAEPGEGFAGASDSSLAVRFELTRLAGPTSK